LDLQRFTRTAVGAVAQGRNDVLKLAAAIRAAVSPRLQWQPASVVKLAQQQQQQQQQLSGASQHTLVVFSGPVHCSTLQAAPTASSSRAVPMAAATATLCFALCLCSVLLLVCETLAWLSLQHQPTECVPSRYPNAGDAD
jgi:hypothetical protein